MSKAEALECIASNRCFGGVQNRYQHHSAVLDCSMRFSVFFPPQALDEKGSLSGRASLPLLYWLSGLTCSDENFVHKAGAQRLAAQLGLVLAVPDTSPRGEGVPDDPEGAYDLGLGAGFYVNATQEPWKHHYRMYDYITGEFPDLIAASFPVDPQRQSVSGHSMGGHGALVVALRNAGQYRSVSAFAPIAAPSMCPWGEKALGAYLGADRELWKQYDASELIRAAGDEARSLPMLIDQGEADSFLEEQLKPEQFLQACREAGAAVDYRPRPGYDHSYFYIASFIDEHLRFHYEALRG